MRRVYYLLTIIILLAGCGVANSQKENVLNVTDFENRLHATPDAQLIDVRTDDEFDEGHLANALHMNVNSEQLEMRSKYLDKNKPLFVYCYSGGRSAKACEYFRKEGFKLVYDLKGGYSAWTDANKPVEGKKTTNLGMGLEDFNNTVAKGKTLVDVNAPWCAPCVKMKPTLDSLETAWKGQVQILQLDKDKNQLVAKTLNVQELPVLLLYNDGKLIKRVQGYQTAEQLAELVK